MWLLNRSTQPLKPGLATPCSSNLHSRGADSSGGDKHTAGQFKLVVTDNGSECQGVMDAAIKVLRIEHKFTAPHRSEVYDLDSVMNPKYCHADVRTPLG